MTQVNIQYKGIRHSPSDITGVDGDLLDCANLVHEDGELKPIDMPKMIERLSLNQSCSISSVHNVNGMKVLVCVTNENSNGTLKFITDENQVVQIYKQQLNVNQLTIYGETILFTEIVGNTIIVGTNKSTHYLLYKNGVYKYLGDKIPSPHFMFSMTPNTSSESYNLNEYLPNPSCYVNNGETLVPGGGIPLKPPTSGTDTYLELDPTSDNETNRRAISENLTKKVTVSVNEAKKEGRFIYPFFVRYAVRMYDGNYVMHSGPILMLPSTDESPLLAYISIIGNDGYDDGSTMNAYLYANIAVQFKARALRYKFEGWYGQDNNYVNNIEEWSDIIKGADIFLSSQIPTQNDDYYANIKNIPSRFYNNIDSSNVPTYGNSYVVDANRDDYVENLQTINFENAKANTPDPSQASAAFFNRVYYYYFNIRKNYFFPLKSYSKEQIREKISNTSIFYLAKRYDLDRIKERWDAAKFLHNEIEYGELERLESSPTLTDDYLSRFKISAKVPYSYNQRLVLGNIMLKEPLWYKQFVNMFETGSVMLCFVIEKPEKTIYINTGDIEDVGGYYFGHYIYFPDKDCKKIIVRIAQKLGDEYYEIPMTEHIGLNGSFCIFPNLESITEAGDNGHIETSYVGTIPQTSSDAERYFSMPHTVFMSDVANPFYFDTKNMKDIGRMEVVGIAANVNEVSSGQFGQYPLYIFCTDGIIGINIDQEGNFGGISSISSDVLVKPNAIGQPTLIQTNQVLVFLTSRGVMALSGSKVNCISEVMEGRHFNALTELNDIKIGIGAFDSLIENNCDNVPFRRFAENGYLAYDYAHNRVLLFNDAMNYAYVYSQNGLWSKIVPYTNADVIQMPDNWQEEMQHEERSQHHYNIDVKHIKAAVNNYVELYLQDDEGNAYKCIDVKEENANPLHHYGMVISRPIRFGTDEYKTLNRILNRATLYNKNSAVKMALYGSRDGLKYGKINTLRGMSYQYYIFVIYTYLRPNERYSYMSVDFERRMQNKLR